MSSILRTIALTFGVVTVSALLTACGAATDDLTARGAGDDLPRCSDIWQQGQELPLDYDGCATAEGTVAADFRTCPSGQRFGYASFRDELFARAGGRIVGADGLAELRKYCLDK